jgi:hypothetical protein
MTTVGLPSELKPELDYSLPAGMSSYHVRVTPANLSQVQSSTQTLTASSTLQLTNTSSNIIFEVPTQAGANVVIDPRFSSISFRANYEIVSAGGTANVTNAQLRSHAMAYFNRSYTQAGGVILEDIANYDIINDFIVQQEFSVADRDALAASYGFSYESSGAQSENNANGHKINGIDATTTVAVSTKYYSYCVPLLNSVIGKGATKFFNISKVNKMQIVFTTSPNLPITMVTGTAGTAATFRVTLDNFQLNLVYINLGEASKLLAKAGPQYYNAVTWRSSTSTLAAGISGNTTNLVGVRGSSVRALWVKANEITSSPSTTASVNGIFDSKAIIASALSWNIGGLSVPSNPVNTSNNPALAFLQTLQAYNSFDPMSMRSSVVPTRYFTYIPGGTLPTDADQLYTVASTASTVASQCMWSWGISLETVAKSGILDGANLNGSSTFFNANLLMASTNAISLYYIAKMDVIFIIDESGNVSVRI